MPDAIVVVSQTGPQGPTGPQGNPGSGIIIKGHYDTLAELVAAHPSGAVGDCYTVGATGTVNELYVWDATKGWLDAGNAGTPGPAGPDGPKGDPGVPGEPGQPGEPGAKGDPGEPGKDGPVGPAGKDGKSIEIKGFFDTAAELIAAHPVGEPGDSYLIGQPAHIYSWNTDTSAWADGGVIQGPAGPKGDAGIEGPPGKDGAKGDQGDPGVKGDPGVAGAKGDQGDPGLPGKDGGPGKDGEKGDKGDPGKDGAAGLKGDKGDRGTNGTNGLDGKPGDTGPVGPQGQQGIPGKNGGEASYDLITATTGNFNNYLPDPRVELTNLVNGSILPLNIVLDGSVPYAPGRIINITTINGFAQASPTNGAVLDTGSKGRLIPMASNGYLLEYAPHRWVLRGPNLENGLPYITNVGPLGGAGRYSPGAAQVEAGSIQGDYWPSGWSLVWTAKRPGEPDRVKESSVRNTYMVFDDLTEQVLYTFTVQYKRPDGTLSVCLNPTTYLVQGPAQIDPITSLDDSGSRGARQMFDLGSNTADRIDWLEALVKGTQEWVRVSDGRDSTTGKFYVQFYPKVVPDECHYMVRGANRKYVTAPYQYEQFTIWSLNLRPDRLNIYTDSSTGMNTILWPSSEFFLNDPDCWWIVDVEESKDGNLLSKERYIVPMGQPVIGYYPKNMTSGVKLTGYLSMYTYGAVTDKTNQASRIVDVVLPKNPGLAPESPKVTFVQQQPDDSFLVKFDWEETTRGPATDFRAWISNDQGKTIIGVAESDLEGANDREFTFVIPKAVTKGGGWYIAMQVQTSNNAIWSDLRTAPVFQFPVIKNAAIEGNDSEES